MSDLKQLIQSYKQELGEYIHEVNCIKDMESKLDILLSQSVQEAKAEEAEKHHDWKMVKGEGHWYPVCEKCGYIMSRDRKMGDCQGVVEITTRKSTLNTKGGV